MNFDRWRLITATGKRLSVILVLIVFFLPGCSEATGEKTVRTPKNVPQPSETGGERFEGKPVKIPQ